MTLLLLLAFTRAVSAQSIQTTANPGKTLGATECGECHSSEERVWNMSAHFRSNNLHRDPRTRTRAIDIATRMGIYARDIPTHARCVGCHGTTQEDRLGILRVIGGVSCESCHGAGLDYIDVHGEIDDYPSRERRRDLATSKGMRYPHDIHALGSSCFQCHIIDDEKLVNTGGHPARSRAFNLVSWSQGEMRHNFYDNNMVRHKGLNHSASTQRCRILYVTGLLLDLEYTLRALSRGEQHGLKYHETMGARARAIIDTELPALMIAFGGKEKSPAPIVEIFPILEITDLTGPSPNLLAAAIAIEQKTKSFLELEPELPAAIDNLIPAGTVGEPYDPAQGAATAASPR